MNQVPVKWVHERDLHEQCPEPHDFTRFTPVIERSALREVVEGLKRIAEPKQELFATTTDAIRALSATLKMLNAGRDEAQRLLAKLGEGT